MDPLKKGDASMAMLNCVDALVLCDVLHQPLTRLVCPLLALGCLLTYSKAQQATVNQHNVLVTTQAVLGAMGDAAAYAEPQQDRESWQDLDRKARESLEDGHYREGLRAALSALSVASDLFARDDPTFAEALSLVGGAYFHNGDYESSEKYYKQAIDVQYNALRAGHGNKSGLANDLNNLGALYESEGRYDEARNILESAMQIGEQYSRQTDLADQLNNLGIVCKNLGDYAAAESFYNRAREIRENGGENDEPRLAIVLDNLAGLYSEQGRQQESAQLREESLNILEKRLPEGHPDIAIAKHNLALTYEGLHDYATAERLLQTSIDASARTLGASHSEVIAMRDDLAELLGKEHKYDQAEAAFKRTQQFFQNEPTANRLNLARSLSNLAKMYSDQGKYSDAQREQKQAVEIWEHALPAGHPTLTTGQANLALIYFALGQSVQAQPLFEKSITSLKQLFDRQFTYMSESERLSFLRSVESRFPIYLSFCLKFRDQNPELVGNMYNLLLWEKGIVASSVSALRERLAHRGSGEALSILNKLMSKRTEIAQRRASEPTEEQQKTIAYLEQEANVLERELIKRTPGQAEKERLNCATWNEVQKALTRDEAAIEFVRFPLHNGRTWTPTSVYVALVVTSDTKKQPALIPLGDAAELEGSPLNDYRKSVGLKKDPSALDSPSFYTAFWKPLEESLGGRKHIYISPDGVLNQVPFGAVVDSERRFLMDTYRVDTLLSTRDLLRSREGQLRGSAVLMGNPKFDLSEAGQRIAIRILSDYKSKPSEGAVTCASHPSQETIAPGLELSTSEVGRGIISSDLQNSPLDELPDTAKGIDMVRDLLAKQGWDVEVYTAECALEEAVKRVQGPRVLHLATHGFFEPDQESGLHDSIGDSAPSLEDPMLRSGLFFAGANRALRHEASPHDLDDGVLTAYEATALDLAGTEIVTLSGCDTGLGQVRRGEGVFGLRRALGEAGAESILMSMWEVPQTQTQELMTLFYKGWLVSHLDKNEALREAQRKEREIIKQRYHKDVPNYWAAWVLVGR
jgi:CHAT domain-containing protein/Tfp pilus assembly protein PilF